MTFSTPELALGAACLLGAGFAVSRRWSSRAPRVETTDEPKETKKPLEHPDPDPLYDFDLATAHTRNHIYVNKTLRFPYFQVRLDTLCSEMSQE